MAWILNIETATKACSVALGNNGDIIVCREVVEEKYSHAEKLHLLIEEVIKKSGIQLSDLKAIAVGRGPGSYTGLRIGVSAAKGLAYGLGIPLISVSTLHTMTAGVLNENPDIQFFCPMLDARRMEVYTMMLDGDLNELEPVKAIVLDEKFRQDYLSKDRVLFFGDGAFKFNEIASNDHALFEDRKYPSSQDMVKLSYTKFIKEDFEDSAYFEPFYLKDFVAGKPKKMF